MSPPAPGRPNVLLVVLDDVGQDQIGLYDPENAYPEDPAAGRAWFYARLPRLESLAAEGVVFPLAYANPICSPTRAALFTGRYAFRTGAGAQLSPAQTSPTFEELGVSLPHTPRTEFLLARAATRAGVASGFFGKWHLSLPDKDIAPDTGQERWLGWDHLDVVAGWDHWFAQFSNLTKDPVPPPSGGFFPGYYDYLGRTKGEAQTEQLVGPEHYATLEQARRCGAWIQRQGKARWLGVLSFSAPHGPYQFPPEDLVGSRFYLTHRDQAVWPNYSAMLEAIDRALGELLDSLDPAVRANTVVIVYGDNGTPNIVHASARDFDLVQGQGIDLGTVYNTELLIPADGGGATFGYKRSLRESGIRVPLIVHGPVVKAPGRRSRVMVDAVDLYATCAELLGVRPSSVLPPGHGFDGVSFVPALRRPELALTEHARRFTLSERFAPNGEWTDSGDVRRAYTSLVEDRGARENGRYKLLRSSGKGDRLYHLHDLEGRGVDAFETNPLDLSVGVGQDVHARLTAELQRLVGPEA